MSLRVAPTTDVHHGSDGDSVRGTVAWKPLEGALAEMANRESALLVGLGDRVNGAEPEGARAALDEVEDFAQLEVFGRASPRARQGTGPGTALS